MRAGHSKISGLLLGKRGHLGFGYESLSRFKAEDRKGATRDMWNKQMGNIIRGLNIRAKFLNQF